MNLPLSQGWNGELELGLIQTHMAQKPVLRVEVGARAGVRVLLHIALINCTVGGSSPVLGSFMSTPRPLCINQTAVQFKSKGILL